MESLADTFVQSRAPSVRGIYRTFRDTVPDGTVWIGDDVRDIAPVEAFNQRERGVADDAIKAVLIMNAHSHLASCSSSSARRSTRACARL
jgi:hypothetical protein